MMQTAIGARSHRLGRCLLGLMAAAALATAVAASSASASIVIGQSIAGAKLGDTKQQVEQTLGPLSYSESSNLLYPSRQRSLHVHFTNGKLDLVSLFTAAGQKTATGIEVGSTRRQFEHAYPHANCVPGGYDPHEVICTIQAQVRGYKSHTSFWFSRLSRVEQVELAYTLGPGGLVRTAQAAGIRLTGPLSGLSLCTPYTYTVTLSTSKSYRHAVITLDAPAATVPYQPKTVNLTAGRPWTGHFTVYFKSPNSMSRGLSASISVLPPHRSYIGLYSRHYAATLAPGQGEASRTVGGSGCGPVSSHFGS